MRTPVAIILVFGSAMISLAPAAAFAQSDGCPWCTTPTTCAEVDENTNIGGCFNFGTGCQTIAGSCTIRIEKVSVLERATLLRRTGIQYSGTVEAQIWGERRELAHINGDYYAEWRCTGQLATLFMKDPAGQWVELNPAFFANRLSLLPGRPWSSFSPARSLSSQFGRTGDL